MRIAALHGVEQGYRLQEEGLAALPVAEAFKSRAAEDGGRLLLAAAELVQRLAGEKIDAIYSSPLERARETAAPLAEVRGLSVQIAPALLEIDFGDWTGCSLEDLRTREEWKRFVAFQSSVRIPGGESMAEVQSRMVGFVQRLAHEHPDSTLALFSHGDPLRTVLVFY